MKDGALGALDRDVRVITVSEEDKVVSPLGIKGIGKIGIVGTSVALANDVDHAPGQRLRDCR